MDSKKKKGRSRNVANALSLTQFVGYLRDHLLLDKSVD